MSDPTGPKHEPKCPDCGSDQLYFDTTCYWSPGVGWVASDDFDTERTPIFCMECDAEFSWTVALREGIR